MNVYITIGCACTHVGYGCVCPRHQKAGCGVRRSDSLSLPCGVYPARYRLLEDPQMDQKHEEQLRCGAHSDRQSSVNIIHCISATLGPSRTSYNYGTEDRGHTWSLISRGESKARKRVVYFLTAFAVSGFFSELQSAYSKIFEIKSHSSLSSFQILSSRLVS